MNNDKTNNQLQSKLAELVNNFRQNTRKEDSGQFPASAESCSLCSRSSMEGSQSYGAISQNEPKPDDIAHPYHISNLIDMPVFFQLMDLLYKVTEIPYSILDDKNNILQSRGWQDICKYFHRVHPQTKIKCRQSNTYIFDHWHDVPYAGYRCLNGLMDYSVPIVIEGRYLGGIFLGQFLHNPPDEEFFLCQARYYEFDEKTYMEALGRVPIISESRIKSIMLFYSQFVKFLAGKGLEKQRHLDSVNNAIRERDERLKSVWNISNDGFWTRNLETDEFYISPGLIEILGYSPDECEDHIKLWPEFIHPDDIANVTKAFYEYINGTTAHFEAEYRMMTKSGEWKWIYDRGQVMARNNEGRPLRVAGAVLDLTALKKAEHSLIESENKFFKAFHCSPDLMTITTMDEGRYVDINNAFQKTTGYERYETIGHTADELNVWAVPEQRDLLLKLVKDHGTVQGFELEMRLKSGEIRTFSFSGERIDIDDQAHILSVFRDVTDSKKIVEQLRYSEECLSKAFDVSPFIMAITTLEEGRFLKVNNSFCSIIGHHHEEVVGRTTLELGFWSDPEDRCRFKQIIISEHSAQDLEFYFLKKGGEQRLGKFFAELIDIRGEPCVLTVINDITDLRQMEVEMTRLDRLNLVGEMAAGIGHEIRNPMTTVRGYLQILRENRTDQGESEHIDLMIEELDRANSIITEFLSLAKNKRVELKAENLNVIINRLLPLIEASAVIRDQYINLRLESLPDLMVDRKEIRQLLINLVNNGFEAMSSSGIVTIRTFVEQDSAVLAIQDQGHGISSEILDKLGTPFLTTKEQGTGLGLPVCYRIAARHNAKIDVRTDSTGTTFFVRFPIPII